MVGLSLVAVTAVLLYRLFRRHTDSSSLGAILAFVTLELVAVVQIESLSLFAAYRRWPVTVLWGLVAACVWLALRRAPRPARSCFSFDVWEWIVGAACACLLAGTLVGALWGTPNTWDALTYHLPRVMHWLQDASIAHYPTAIPRQLKMPPLAEILLSQTVLLSGGDRLVNLVQWSTYGVAALGIYAIVRSAGLPRLAGMCGALLFLSVPIAVLQASGPKNDVVTCANVAATIAFLHVGTRELRWGWIFAGAMALGAAILTKGTSFLLGGVIAALFAAVVLWRHGGRNSLRAIALLALVVGVINGGHWSRNVRWFGTPLGPQSAAR
ncbi:MAG: glycosyltransferase family 39 protein, partial [Candidatus Binatia bacterium]